MPVIEVWRCKKAVIMKRSIGGASYSGEDNPTFYKDNADMLLGNADKVASDIATALKSAQEP